MENNIYERIVAVCPSLHKIIEAHGLVDEVVMLVNTAYLEGQNDALRREIDKIVPHFGRPRTIGEV